jgi:HAD superfamily hydrolase (TIGR01490 family)
MVPPRVMPPPAPPTSPTPRQVAFFDLDRTLLPHHTSLLYLRLMLQDGQVGVWTLVRAGLFLTLYFFNMVDTQKVVSDLVRRAAGGLEEENRVRGQRCVDALVVPRLSRLALDRLEWHRAQGHRLCILSASPTYVVEPLARHLEMDALCTRFSVLEGRLTGELDGPLCYGRNKVEAASAYAAQHGLTLEQCHFYTDSASDLPLLENVGFPVAVNADPSLLRVARRHQWPVMWWG